MTIRANRQPCRMRRRETALSSAVRSLRTGPIVSREESANFVKELLLSISRNSEAGMKGLHASAAGVVHEIRGWTPWTL